jgi:hypothetical protein
MFIDSHQQAVRASVVATHQKVFIVQGCPIAPFPVSLYTTLNYIYSTEVKYGIVAKM